MVLYVSTTERQRSLVQLYSTCGGGGGGGGGGGWCLVIGEGCLVIGEGVYDLRCDPVVLATVCPLSMATGSLSTM